MDKMDDWTGGEKKRGDRRTESRAKKGKRKKKPGSRRSRWHRITKRKSNQTDKTGSTRKPGKIDIYCSPRGTKKRI